MCETKKAGTQPNARRDGIEQLQSYMAACLNARFGIWTNGDDRYVFEKVEGDDAAPDFIQFSDHGIFPEDASHYHLYWGDDRAALLEEVTNWPTYYPSSLSSEEIAQEMLAH